jgi:hypothetical protein
MKAKRIYLVVQEGGSSTEIYLHTHDTLKESNADRKDCSKNGAYRTSVPVEVPQALTKVLLSDAHAEYAFYTVVEKVLKASLNLE